MKNFLSDPESEGITCYYLYHHSLVSHRRESPDLTLARIAALSLLKSTNRRTDESSIAFDAASSGMLAHWLSGGDSDERKRFPLVRKPSGS